MLVIRLARAGRAKYPTYRIVAAESARAATGKFVEILGHYNPHTKDLVIKRDEVSKRLSQGAQPSNTVVKLLLRDGVELPAWVKLKTKAPKVDPAAAPADASAPADVTEAEASADADAAPADEPRVAATATDAAAEAGDDVPTIDHTATADSEAAVPEATEAGVNAAAKANTPKAD